MALDIIGSGKFLQKKIKLGVLFGGRSSEHEVSVISARNVLAAINPDKYEVIPIGVTKQGSWVALPSDKEPTLALQGKTVTLLPDPKNNYLVALENSNTAIAIENNVNLKDIDIVFPLFHGPYGEDGTIQGLLELANLPYVGSGVASSAIGMDKAILKNLFKQHGLPVTPFNIVLRRQWQANPQQVHAYCEASFPYPWFVKPANMGSSVGISKVHGPEEFKQAMDEACLFDRKILIEAGVEDAREIELAVLGNDDPIVSVAGEIIPCNEFYDYKAKYIDESSELIVPVDLKPEVLKSLQDMSIQAFKAIDCAGMARVDFLVRRRDNAIFISEINTIPGFTPISMYPKLWQASGISYSDLIDRLIELAFERHADKQQNKLLIPK